MHSFYCRFDSSFYCDDKLLQKSTAHPKELLVMGVGVSCALDCSSAGMSWTWLGLNQVRSTCLSFWAPR